MKHIGLIFSVLALVVFTVPAHAFCEPATTVCSTASDKTCNTLGKTTMDKDQQNLLACLGTTANPNCAAGQCQWKLMSSGGKTGYPINHSAISAVHSFEVAADITCQAKTDAAGLPWMRSSEVSTWAQTEVFAGCAVSPLGLSAPGKLTLWN